jgi:hypothetical protein
LALGSLVAVALGIVLTAPPAHSAGPTVDGTVLLASGAGGVALLYSKQIGGPTTGKQPPIA